MRIARGRTNDRLRLTTKGAVSNSDLDPDSGNFAILIDINDDRRYDRGLYVFFAAGRIRGALVNLHTNGVIDRTVATSRLSPRAFQTVMLRSKIGGKGTYRFAVASFFQSSPCSGRHPCIDTIPNRFPLIPLDYRAPSVTHIKTWLFSTNWGQGEGGSLRSPLIFDARDNPYGTDLRRWTIQRREVGASGGWEAVRTGDRSGYKEVFVSGVEGATYDLRILAEDRQNNRTLSKIERTAFPFDDRNTSVVSYSGPTVEADDLGAFLDTTTSLPAGATAAFAFDGSTRACVVGGPPDFDALANLRLDSDLVREIFESYADLYRQPLECVTVSDESHVLTVEATGPDPFVVDGFYAIP